MAPGGFVSRFDHHPLSSGGAIVPWTSRAHARIESLGIDPEVVGHLADAPLVLARARCSVERLASTSAPKLCLITSPTQSHRQTRETDTLVFLGRPESIALAKVGLRLGGDEFTSLSVEVDFFGEEGARRLIDAYARLVATESAPYRGHPEPVKQVVDAYFESIESALDLPKATLWSSDEGRAFAGYAPVLAALGSMLARFDNFVEVRNRLLNVAGTHEAWSVIESVLKAILDREQRKLTNQLEKSVTVALPPETYDAYEQLTLLSQLIHGQSPVGSGRVQLPPADQVSYHRMVEQYLQEHPFVRQGQPANGVLGSLILAHAVYHDRLRSADLALLGDVSRQPFLWRSLSANLDGQPTLVDGRYVGFILSSFWNDTSRQAGSVEVRSTVDDSARVFLPLRRHRTLSIEVTLPLSLYGQARQISIDVDGDLEIHGQAVRNAGSALFVRGPVDILCRALKVEADVIAFEGRVWLEASNVTGRARLSLNLRPGAEVGWGGVIRDTYPWNRFPSTVQPPYSTPPRNVLEALVDECWRRLPPGAAITLHTVTVQAVTGTDGRSEGADFPCSDASHAAVM